MRVEIVDAAVHAFHRHAHAAHRAFARGRDHVRAVGSDAIAEQLGMDARATLHRVFVVLQHQHAATGTDDETVALGVIRTRGDAGAIVVAGGQRAHRVEHHAHGPVQFFAATGEDDVLRAVADQVGTGADAVRGSRAGGGDRIAQAADLEGGGQRGRYRRAHRARHHVRPHLAHAARAQDVGRFHLPLAGTAAGASDQAGAQVADLGLVEAGVGDGVAHRQVGIRGGIAHEALELAVDQRVQVELDLAADLAAQADLGMVGQEGQARTAFAQRARYAVQIVAQATGDAHAGDDDATHAQKPSVEVNRPTRRSLAV